MFQNFDKYITASFPRSSSGIGNQMFRMASLYGIGLHFNRSVFFSTENKWTTKMMNDYKKTFPNLFSSLKVLDNSPNETLRSDFALDCCSYQNPNIMHDVAEKFLILNGNYLQSWKYFNHKKSDIINLYDFSPEIKAAISQKMLEIFKNDDTHKLCVHVRRGDFLRHELQESRADFIDASLPFLSDYLLKQNIPRVSLIFLGQYQNFIEDLKFDATLFHHIYKVSFSSRGEDLYFGSKACNTLLMSASGSTFAWWIGYLMPERSRVFYNGQISKHGNYSRDYYDFDFFPPQWNRLDFNNLTNSVTIDNRWHFERYGWPVKGIPPLF